MECGWDFKFIARNFTLSQIKEYYYAINRIKRHEYFIVFSGIRNSTGSAFGSIKEKDYKKFIEIFEDKQIKKVDVMQTIDQLKKDGIIEEQ